MPAPNTVAELLELIQKSGVIDDARLSGYLQQLQSAGAPLPTEPSKFAGLLIRDGLLTYFQAEQFLLGKWKRFQIGKYKVLERLGAGGMGQVFLCEHKLMRRRVAVKVLPTAKAEDPSSLERFYREARAVAALDHPNIVRAYDIDQDDNLHFLVMEYVDGSSLQEIVKKVGPMDPIRAAHYMSQSAAGLQHAFDSAGLVHRDIKPGNVLVDRTGTVKILDMGLARFFHDEEDLLTKQYDENVLGTADYLAPEQALDSHSVDNRADIYSLGATFYFLLTGSPPFAEGTVAQKLIWHQTRQPKAIASLRSGVPLGLVAVIDKMMAKDVRARYQKPSDVIEVLRPWTGGSIPPPPEAEMPQLSPAAMASLSSSTTTSPPGTPVAARAPSPAPAAVRAPSGTVRAAVATPPAPPRVAAVPPTPANGSTALPAAIAPPPPPAPPAKQEGGSNLFWEALTNDAGSAAAPADGNLPSPYSVRSSGRPASRSSRHTAPSAKLLPTRQPTWLYVGLGALAIALLVGLGVFLAVLLRRKPQPDQRGSSEPAGTANRLFVTRSDGVPNPYRQVRAALARAKPGDTIV